MTALACWLNANANLVTALASAATALATVVLALFGVTNVRLLRWEREKDRRNRQPIVALTEDIAPQSRDLQLKNVGYGPALNVVRVILATGHLTRHATTDVALPIAPLGPGDSAYGYCNTLPGHTSVSILDEPELRVLVEYDDIFGKHYETHYGDRQHSTAQIKHRQIPWEQVQRI